MHLCSYTNILILMHQYLICSIDMAQLISVWMLAEILYTQVHLFWEKPGITMVIFKFMLIVALGDKPWKSSSVV